MPDPQPPDDAPPRLGYLLKHAALRYAELTSTQLAPLRITPQEWAALNCLDAQHGRSQKEVAELLGIDRTSMVTLIDQLQTKGWVERRPHPGDRRKNAVTLTKSGRGMLRDGARIIDDCERRFLSTLGDPGADQLKRALHRVITANE
ncbi:MarR family transcriptional regulator [Nocardia tenerifensis]|uniref:MarR family transcriptional regulator n=1 Tax=Nocardia tenerifensis TaxID=228006 RepID=A0A318K1S6_9NOCA|nr:MarR family transcriptional regulator [Nocardia tenerifensis]PXX61115.1 MarR family transcriptional regulator [Nocardia tenerifensis]